MQTKTLHFVRKYDTKGAVRYVEVDETGADLTGTGRDTLTTLYIRKASLDVGAIPEKLLITMEEEK